MDPDTINLIHTIIGVALVALSLGGLVVVVVWSVRRINRISRSRGGSARAIEKELDGGR